MTNRLAFVVCYKEYGKTSKQEHSKLIWSPVIMQTLVVDPCSLSCV